MSKKKNTLKDLDEFLKQQAASLVAPEPVKLPADPAPSTDEPKVVENIAVVETKPQPEPVKTEINEQTVLRDLIMLAQKNPDAFRKNFYDTIIKTLEAYPTRSPEDKMLINTALYLKSGERWKDVIRDYWKKNS